MQKFQQLTTAASSGRKFAGKSCGRGQLAARVRTNHPESVHAKARQLQLDRLNCLKVQLQARLIHKPLRCMHTVTSKSQAAHISRWHSVANGAEPHAASRCRWRAERALTSTLSHQQGGHSAATLHVLNTRCTPHNRLTELPTQPDSQAVCTHGWGQPRKANLPRGSGSVKA